MLPVQDMALKVHQQRALKRHEMQWMLFVFDTNILDDSRQIIIPPCLVLTSVTQQWSQ